MKAARKKKRWGKVGEGGGRGGNGKKYKQKMQKTNSRIELENSEELFLNLGHSGIL